MDWKLQRSISFHEIISFILPLFRTWRKTCPFKAFMSSHNKVPSKNWLFFPFQNPIAASIALRKRLTLLMIWSTFTAKIRKELTPNVLAEDSVWKKSALFFKAFRSLSLSSLSSPERWCPTFTKIIAQSAADIIHTWCCTFLLFVALSSTRFANLCNPTLVTAGMCYPYFLIGWFPYVWYWQFSAS